MNHLAGEAARRYRIGHGSTDSAFADLDLPSENDVDERSAFPTRGWRHSSRSFYGEPATTLGHEIRIVLGAVSNWTSPRTWSGHVTGKGAAKAAIAQLLTLANEGLLEEGSPQSVQQLLELAFADEPEGTLAMLTGAMARVGFRRAATYALCDAIGRLSSAKVEALAFLTGLLRSNDASTRDAALLGISLLDDPRSVPALREALARESRTLLRETIENILADM